MKRILFVALALLIFSQDSQAGPLRKLHERRVEKKTMKMVPVVSSVSITTVPVQVVQQSTTYVVSGCSKTTRRLLFRR